MTAGVRVKSEHPWQPLPGKGLPTQFVKSEALFMRVPGRSDVFLGTFQPRSSPVTRWDKIRAELKVIRKVYFS